MRLQLQQIVKNSPEHNINEYLYDLPEDRIAIHPLQHRDQSKLLVWDKGMVSHHIFKDIASHIPAGSLMFFNDTRVIPARLVFHKETGARIEIFLLDPVTPVSEISAAMQAGSGCTWRCLIGNKKKWKPTETLSQSLNQEGANIDFTVEYVSHAQDLLKFTWTGNMPFVQVIELSGETPLPPYLHRPATPEDKSRYQTIYSKHEGAVAAPTAGLHFTDAVFNGLKERNIKTDYLTLHVSASTFKPVKEADYTRHPMHAEQIQLSVANVQNIVENPGRVIAVGTTSMRTLESAYWFGVKLLGGKSPGFFIEKLYPYQHDANLLPTRQEAFMAILDFMKTNAHEKIMGTTEIFIFPGYEFRVCDGLVTNFHLPGSTLLLLVSAFTQNDWQHIYRQAFERGYRFLSYGDSSLLLR